MLLIVGTTEHIDTLRRQNTECLMLQREIYPNNQWNFRFLSFVRNIFRSDKYLPNYAGDASSRM